MEDETCYGILMQRVIIDDGIYLFKPQTILEGNLIIEEDHRLFVDILKFEYDLLENVDTTYYSDNSVGYIIKEDELLSRYPNMDIHKAKSFYLESIFENVHFGFYNLNQDKIKIVKGDLRSILSQINSNDYEEDINLTFEQEKASGLQSILLNEAVIFEWEEFKKMAEEEDGTKIKKQLREIYDAYLKIKGEDITSIIDGIISSSTIEDTGVYLNKLEEKITTNLCLLDNLKMQNIKVDAYEKLLYKLEDIIDTIKETKDLKSYFGEIKNMLIQNFQVMEEAIRKYSLEEAKVKTSNPLITNTINVSEMKAYFDERVIGLEEAKKSIITAIAVNKLAPGKKSNSSLLIGPTGSGKTYLCKVASKYLHLPFEIVDTTQLTVAGYVGANIEDSLANLLMKANGNQDLAEQGIIVFNEIDKKGSDNNSDVSGRGVLNSLLPFIEGTTYNVYYNNRHYHFNTSRLTIFATGAFTDVAKKKKKSCMGFHERTNEPDIIENPITREDLEIGGGVPMELLGRITSIIELPAPTKESLIAIMGAKNSEIEIEREVLSKIGIILEEDVGYREAVAKKALKLKTGARSLKTIIEGTINKARWIVLTNPHVYSKIILTKESVEDNTLCLLKDQFGNFMTVYDIEEKENKQVRKRTLNSLIEQKNKN